jgi:hypothetical protein
VYGYNDMEVGNVQHKRSSATNGYIRETSEITSSKR